MTFFTFLRCVLLNNYPWETKYAPTAVERSQSGQKLSKYMYSLIWNSNEAILSLAHKAMNYFSMIDNIHRSSQVACVQTNLLFPLIEMSALKNVIDHVIT